MDQFHPQPGEVNENGEPVNPAVRVSKLEAIVGAVREALKLPVPNLSTVKTYFESLGPGAGLRTLVTLEPGETIVLTALLVNVENKSATVAKKAVFRIKTKSGGTTMETVVARVAAGTTANAVSLAGPLVFAYTAVAKEPFQVEAELESETESRVSITFYTTGLTN